MKKFNLVFPEELLFTSCGHSSEDEFNSPIESELRNDYLIQIFQSIPSMVKALMERQMCHLNV